MSILATDQRSARRAYLVGTAFTLVFGQVYEYFSHDVTSWWMVFAFLIPLLGGVLSEIGWRITKKQLPLSRKDRDALASTPASGAASQNASGVASASASFIKKRRLSLDILAGAVIWLTLGSIAEGVLEIYGTTNHLVIFFFLAGGLQLIAALILFCFSGKAGK